MISGPTPSQTIGPFFSIALPWAAGPSVIRAGTPGAMALHGHVTDGAGSPVTDALLETWQADPEGLFADDFGEAAPRATPFRGFGRVAVDARGRYELLTLKPGPIPDGHDGRHAPHIDVSIFARGLLHRCVTRIYFADEPRANASDPVLSAVPAARRSTLLAQPVEGGYRFDICLQGSKETVFFDI